MNTIKKHLKKVVAWWNSPDFDLFIAVFFFFAALMNLLTGTPLTFAGGIILTLAVAAQAYTIYRLRTKLENKEVDGKVSK